MKGTTFIPLLITLSIVLLGCQKTSSSDSISSSSLPSSEIIIDPFSENPTLRTISESLPVGELTQSQVQPLLNKLSQNDAYPNRLTYTLKEINHPENGNPNSPYFLNEKTTNFTRYDEPILYVESNGTNIDYGPFDSETNSEMSLQPIVTNIASKRLIYAMNQEETKTIVELDNQLSPTSTKTFKTSAFSALKFIEKITLGRGVQFVEEHERILGYVTGDYWFSNRRESLVKYEKLPHGDVVLVVGLIVRQWADVIYQTINEHTGLFIKMSMLIHDGMVTLVDIINSFMKAQWDVDEPSSEQEISTPVFTGVYDKNDMIFGYAESYRYARENVGEFGVENLWNFSEFTLLNE